jgi:hypothetical protein
MQGEFLSELKGKITDVVIIPVPEGTRVNARFNGTLRRPKVNGTAKGIDYTLFRADGSGILHIHAVITTEEGDLIYLESSGFLTPTEQKGRSSLREVVTCQTASKKYAWLNTTLAVGEGYSDNESGKVYLKYFVPFTSNE